MSENQNRPLVVAVDTETGGAGERQCVSHALLSIGAYVELPDGNPRRFHQLVLPRPDLIIEPEALAVNGYSRTKWQDEGAVEERIAVIRFFAWIYETRSLLAVPKVTLVAHNAGHDRGFVEAAFARWQLLEEFQSVVSRRWRCSCALLGSLQDAGVVPGEMGASLDALTALRLGGTMEGAKAARGVHQADDDAAACWLGYRWLLGKLHRGGAEGAEGWRWLRDDEVREEGDEVEDLADNWWPVGKTVGELQGGFVARCRRRVVAVESVMGKEAA